MCVFGGEGRCIGGVSVTRTLSLYAREVTDLVCTCMVQYVSQTGMEENYMNHYHQSYSFISFQGSFPQIGNGKFMFNGVSQADFDSFLQSLTDCRR